MKRFRELSVGYVTLWPVFMAAVKAYQVEHQIAFREWLDDNDKKGAANRKNIWALIETVWSMRVSIGNLVGLDYEHVIVN